MDLCRGVHAEMNALLQAAVYGISVAGGTMYCTVTPCMLCAKAIINAGIVCVRVAGAYPGGTGVDLLREAHVAVWVHKKEE